MTTRRLWSIAVLPWIVAGTAVTESAAQLNTATGTGVSYQLYRFSDPDAAGIKSIAQLTAPFAVRAPIFGGIRLEVTGAWAQGTLERPDGSTATLSGLTDTQIRLALPIVPDLITVVGLLNLPTGVETPTAAEAEVAGAVASDLLPFRVSNWGSGGGGGAAATLTRSFGAVGFAAGASYQVSREFAPLDDPSLATYRPGDQLTFQALVTRNVGRSNRASLQLVYSDQSEDQLEGNNLYRPGDRFQGIASYAFRAGRTSSGIIYAGGQYRQRGSALLEITRDSPAQTLVLAGAGLRVPGGSAVFSPSFDVRVLRNADGVGQGYLGGLGGTAEWRIGRFTAGPLLRVQLGRVLVREDTQSDVVGGELGMTVSF